MKHIFNQVGRRILCEMKINQAISVLYEVNFLNNSLEVMVDTLRP